MSNNAASNYELVFVPIPGMGHIISTLQLTKLILQRNPSISISIHIIQMPPNSAKVMAYIDSHSRDNPYPTRLTFLNHPPLPNPPESSPISLGVILDLHKPIVKKAVEEPIKAGFRKPVAFVLDMFCTTMLDVANDLGVPSYAFFTSGANMLNLNFYAQSLADDHGDGVDVSTKFNDPGFAAAVPGFKNPVPSQVIPSTLQATGPFTEMLFDLARRFRKMNGILINTYVELEQFPTQALLNNCEDNRTPPVYPVGPLIELESKDHDESITEWLDCQPESSVVFLCFGSMGSFGEEQVKEIAKDLEKSGYRFLWTLRKPPPEGMIAPRGDETFLDALPEGFLDRTADRGKIIGWAPQVTVLAHPAVGGFVSHCGWNSTLESLWHDVPMATWPMYAEQQLNAFELVKELELAVEINVEYKYDMKLKKGNFIISAEEVENGVKKLMSMDEKMRGRVKKMSDDGKKALQQGGSSFKWLGRFIDDVLSNSALA